MAMRRVAALAVCAVTFAACAGASGPSPGVTSIHVPLPTLSGDTLQGGTFSPDLAQGKVLVVNFWATWCGPCRVEQPALQATWERFRGKDVRFVGVDERDNTAQANAWLQEFGVTYPSIEDQAGGFADDFAFAFLPDTYVVDRTGTIRFHIFGATDVQQLSGLIDRVIAGG